MSTFLSAYFQREHDKLRDLMSGGAEAQRLGTRERTRLERVCHLIQHQAAQFEADARSDYALSVRLA